MDDALAGISKDIGDWGSARSIRLESGLWNAIRRSLASRSYVFPGPPESERRRPRLFGVDVVVDETLPPGTWRIER